MSFFDQSQDIDIEKVKERLKAGGGCNIKGDITLKKVKHNFQN